MIHSGGYYWESVDINTCEQRKTGSVMLMYLLEHIYVTILDAILHIYIKDVILIHFDDGVRIDVDYVVLRRRSCWHDIGEPADEFASVLVSNEKDDGVERAKGHGAKLAAKPVIKILYLAGFLQAPT